MVKKLQKMSAKKKTSSAFADALPAGLLDSAIAQNVKDSAQQIWAAGLGAFAKAQGEGGKVFEALVKEGLQLQKKTQSAAEEKLSAMASKVSGMAGDVGSKAGQQWDKLESIFEDRVAKAMKSLGVPSAKDVDALSKRIDALGAAMGVKPAVAKKTSPAKKAAAPEPAAAPAKKAAVAAKQVVKAAKTARTAVKAVAKKAVAAAKPVVKTAKVESKKVVVQATKAVKAAKPAKPVDVAPAAAPTKKRAAPKKTASTPAASAATDTKA